MKRPRWISSRWILRRLVTLPAIPFALVLPVVACMLDRWVKVRFGSMESTRIGHFSGNVELALCQLERERQSDHRPLVVLACVRNPIEHGSVSNLFLAELWSRRMVVLPWWLLGPAITVNRILFGTTSKFEIFNNTDRDVNRLLDDIPQSVFLTQDEIDLGWKSLEQFGIPRGALFVVIVARDRGYLLNREPHRDFSYHDYRNADINTFASAAMFLVEKGYFVIRIGRDVETRFEVQHPMVFDYSHSGIQSDFLDVFLVSECNFMVSTQTGIDSVAHFVFRKPTLMVNVAPVGVVLSSRVWCMATFKRFVDKVSGSELSLEQLGERNLIMETKSIDFLDEQVSVVDNTADEIRDAVEDMVLMLREGGMHHSSAEQSRFAQALKEVMGERYGEYHGDFCVQIGPRFLSSSGLIGSREKF
jgi:putative glycosyltransferase (TIGR04372 family)